MANDVAAPGVGFGHDTNAVLILGADGSSVEIPLSSKRAVAGAILDAVARRLSPDPADRVAGGHHSANQQSAHHQSASKEQP